MQLYDLVIIGAGPASLSAAIYAARYKLKTLVIGKEIGGHAIEAFSIENYPGFRKISGTELLAKFKEQVKAARVDIFNEEVKVIKKINEEFEIKTDKITRKSRALILALGSKRKRLNVPGEQEFLGKGVSYCAVCDGPLYKNKEIAIIGGGDSAVAAASFMLNYAKKIYIIDIAKSLAAKPADIEMLKKKGKAKVHFLNFHRVNRIKGDNFVSSIEIEDLNTKQKKELKVQGIIVEIGMEPLTELARELGVKLNEDGFIITDKEMKTNVAGVFAAGDCIAKPLRQIITAASDGAIAAYSTYEYLKRKS